MTMDGHAGKVRIALGCVLLFLAGVAGCASFSRAVMTARPDLAVNIWPWNGAALARLAAQRLNLQDNASVEDALSLARQALNLDPINPVAMRTIGLAETTRQHLPQARHAFGLVERMTRRDAGTNLWLIEYYVNHNDVDRTLLYYDRALRTSGAAPAILFPILLSAMDIADIRLSFIRRFRQSPPDWVTDFFSFAVGNPKAPPAFADVFFSIQQAARGVPEDKVAIFVDRMAHLSTDGDPQAAIRVYESRTGRTVLRQRVGLGDAMASQGERYSFDWSPISAGDVAIDIGEAPGTLVVSTREDFSGDILRRTVALKPGQYSLRLATRQNALPVEIVITCVASSGPIPVTRGLFSVAADCPLQNIILSTNQGGSDKMLGPLSIASVDFER